MHHQLAPPSQRRIGGFAVEAILHRVAVDGADLHGAEIVQQAEDAVQLVLVVGSGDVGDERVQLMRGGPAIERFFAGSRNCGIHGRADQKSYRFDSRYRSVLRILRYLSPNSLIICGLVRGMSLWIVHAAAPRAGANPRRGVPLPAWPLRIPYRSWKLSCRPA